MDLSITYPTCDTGDMIVPQSHFQNVTPFLCPMLHQLKLPNGPNTITLTYDGLGLRVEGAVDVEQKGKLAFIRNNSGSLETLMFTFLVPSREPTYTIRLDFTSYRQG